MQKIKVVTSSDEVEFEKEVNMHLEKGYKVSSTYCGFVQSESYDFCSSLTAILIIEQ